MIECLIEANNIKCVNFLVNEIIKKGNEKTLNLLIQDLPILL